MLDQLHFLGTGNAFATKVYNSCFAIQFGSEYFLVDAGGGNGILTQCQKKGIEISSIRYHFVSHNHSDHALGSIWIIRMIGTLMHQNQYEGKFTVYGHRQVIDFLRYICFESLPSKFTKFIDDRILFQEVRDAEQVIVENCAFTFFDIQSVKLKQFGFTMKGLGGNTITFLGDEPYNPENINYVKEADCLICEAFCLYSERDTYNPYEKHHSTVKEAAELAETLNVKNLILVHTEEDTLPHRKERYTQEAQQYFHGKIHIPEDLETVLIDEQSNK